MITRTDCILLLSDLEERGIDTTAILKETLKNAEPTLTTIKFINDNRELALAQFYEKIRKSYNKKKSNLYINITSVPFLIVVSFNIELKSNSSAVILSYNDGISDGL